MDPFTLCREDLLRAHDRITAWQGATGVTNSHEPRFHSITEAGIPLEEIVDHIAEEILSGAVNRHHPTCIAHLEAIPTAASVLGEFIAGATNQSLDTWLGGPSATALEQYLMHYFCGMIGYPAGSDGIMTAGGTMSNQMAVLLARDNHLERRYGIDAKQRGVPAEVNLRIFCSERAHYSIDRAAAMAGIGVDAVVKVATDDRLTLEPAALQEAILSEKEKGNDPFLVVATAGKTDTGNVPDLLAVRDIAAEQKIWYHVDAAHGGALLLSEKYRHLLNGIDLADSATFDPHKMLYQPASCSMFLLRNEDGFRHLTFHADYLNPEEDERVNLVDRSLQTTRRFDALKLYMSLLHLGSQGYDRLITDVIDRAQGFSQMIRERDGFELAVESQTNILPFRYTAVDNADAFSTYAQRTLFESGAAALSRTVLLGNTYLKATCMNPYTEDRHFEGILDDIERIAKE